MYWLKLSVWLLEPQLKFRLMKFVWPRFAPRLATTTTIDGVFLVDSIVFYGGAYGRPKYMEDALQYVLLTTGLYCMAIVVPGAWYGIFSASSIPADYGSNFFVVVLACGNDVYSLARQKVDPFYLGGLRTRMVATDILRRFTALLQKLCRRTNGGILLVFGGASDVWSDVDFAAVYNVYVKLVVDALREMRVDAFERRVSVLRGEALRGIISSESVGHVSDTRLGPAVMAYVSFALQTHSSKL